MTWAKISSETFTPLSHSVAPSIVSFMLVPHLNPALSYSPRIPQLSLSILFLGLFISDSKAYGTFSPAGSPWKTATCLSNTSLNISSFRMASLTSRKPGQLHNPCDPAALCSPLIPPLSRCMDPSGFILSLPQKDRRSFHPQCPAQWRPWVHPRE